MGFVLRGGHEGENKAIGSLGYINVDFSPGVKESGQEKESDCFLSKFPFSSDALGENVIPIALSFLFPSP